MYSRRRSTCRGSRFLLHSGRQLAKLRRGRLGRDRVERYPDAELERVRSRKPRDDVDPPAETLGPAWCGADPQARRRALAEALAQQRQPAVQERGTRSAVVLEALAAPARDQHEL